MAELSPYLNENPKVRAYALGTVSRNLLYASGSWSEITIRLNGAIYASTGRIRDEGLKGVRLEAKIYRRKRKDKIKVRLTRTKWFNGYPYTAVFPIAFTTSPPRNGQVTVVVTGSSVQTSRAMRKARAWASKLVSANRGARRPRTQSTALRPSPESIIRPFLKTLEFDNGSYTKVQSIVPSSVYSRTWTGTRTPGFGSKRATALPDNPHTVVIVNVNMNEYSWYQVRPANGTYHLEHTTWLDKMGLPALPMQHVSLAEFNALKRLIASANQGIQANLAQNIAQVSQLSRLLTANIAKVTSSLNQLRRGNIPGAISSLGSGQSPRWRGSKGAPSAKKSLANNWLELQYGWKPLLYDIEAMLQIMAAPIGDQDHVQRVRSSATVSRQVVERLPDTTAQHGSNNGKSTYTYRSTAKFNVRFRVDNPILNLFSQTGFTNPVNLFWEILPFSFVVDWFLPIGSYLEALNAWDGVTFLGGSKVLFTRVKRDSTIAYVGPHPADAAVNVQNFANYHSERIQLDRSALMAFPSPVRPSFNIRGVEGGNRAANAIALLTKAFR